MRAWRSLSAPEQSVLMLASYLFEIETTDAPDFQDVTDDVLAMIADSGVIDGQVTVFSCHTTAAIRINENEPLLLRDLARVIRHIVPADTYYEHNDFGRRTVNMTEDECANGHSHCQLLFLATSEIIPIVKGQLALGPYQRIFLIELDHPRDRRVIVNVLGRCAQTASSPTDFSG